MFIQIILGIASILALILSFVILVDINIVRDAKNLLIKKFSLATLALVVSLLFAYSVSFFDKM
jgi:hypothetical protein